MMFHISIWFFHYILVVNSLTGINQLNNPYKDEKSHDSFPSDAKPCGKSHSTCPAFPIPGTVFLKPQGDVIAHCANSTTSPLLTTSERSKKEQNESTSSSRRPWSVLFSKLNYLSCQDPVVIAIPGGPGDDVGYLSWITEFSYYNLNNKPVSVLLIDPAGCGRSSNIKNVPNRNVHEWAQSSVNDIRTVLQFWRNGNKCKGENIKEQIYILGHSVGSVVSLTYEKMFPVQGMFLLSPSIDMKRWKKDAELYTQLISSDFVSGDLKSIDIKDMKMPDSNTGQPFEIAPSILKNFVSNSQTAPIMMKHMKAFVLGPQTTIGPGICGGTNDDLYTNLWGNAENEVTGAFGKYFDLIPKTSSIKIAVGLLDESTPASALNMLHNNYSKLIVLPHSAHVYVSDDIQRILIPNIINSFSFEKRKDLMQKGHDIKEQKNEDTTVSNFQKHLEEVRSNSFDNIKAFAKATALREAQLNEDANEKPEKPNVLISSLSQLASTAALGKRWHSRDTIAPFSLSNPYPSLMNATGVLDFQDRADLLHLSCMYRRVANPSDSDSMADVEGLELSRTELMRLDQLIQYWLREKHEKRGDYKGIKKNLAHLAWGVFKMSLSMILQHCPFTFPRMVKHLQSILKRHRLIGSALVSKFEKRKHLIIGGAEDEEDDKTASTSASRKLIKLETKETTTENDSDTSFVYREHPEFEPLLIDLYWLTHVLLYHRSGPFSFRHAQCVAKSGEKCNTIKLEGDNDEEISSAITEIERLSPLMVLWLENPKKSSSIRNLSESMVVDLTSQRAMLAKDILSEVVLVLRHFKGLKHPLATALLQRVQKASVSVEEDTTPHTTAVPTALHLRKYSR